MDRVPYVTAAGSLIKPVGTSSWAVRFDWVEEGACIEATCQIDESSRRLEWQCQCCCAGTAPLIKLV